MAREQARDNTLNRVRANGLAHNQKGFAAKGLNSFLYSKHISLFFYRGKRELVRDLKFNLIVELKKYFMTAPLELLLINHLYVNSNIASLRRKTEWWMCNNYVFLSYSTAEIWILHLIYVNMSARYIQMVLIKLITLEEALWITAHLPQEVNVGRALWGDCQIFSRLSLH